MAHLAALILDETQISNLGLWFFLSVGAISLFGIFIPLVTWIDRRAKEREAFYKAEMMRRVTESSSEGAKAAIDLLHADARNEQFKKIEGLKIGGLINIGVGVGLIIFLRSLIGSASGSPYLCGLIPGMIGVAMLVYVYAMARPAE
jgi:hypothetical protein